MLNLIYSYRIYPDAVQEAQMLDWMKQSRRMYNYALRERFGFFTQLPKLALA